MIDTDKYEGHLSDLKEVAGTIEQHMATYALLRDAPLLLEEVKRLRERNDRLCEDLKRTRRWIQKQVQPLKILAGQADLVACTAEKELLNEFMGDD